MGHARNLAAEQRSKTRHLVCLGMLPVTSTGLPKQVAACRMLTGWPRSVRAAKWPQVTTQTNPIWQQSEAKDPSHRAAGQVVMTSALEHSYALFALLD